MTQKPQPIDTFPLDFPERALVWIPTPDKSNPHAGFWTDAFLNADRKSWTRRDDPTRQTRCHPTYWLPIPPHPVFGDSDESEHAIPVTFLEPSRN